MPPAGPDLAEDGVTLPAGATVAVTADGEPGAFETTPEEERELLDAIAGVERGETVRAADLARAAPPVTGPRFRVILWDRAGLGWTEIDEEIRQDETAQVAATSHIDDPLNGNRTFAVPSPWEHSSHRRRDMAGGVNLAGASGGDIDSSEPEAGKPGSMKRATYEDVLNAPEHKVAEILDGELFLSPRPAPRHAVAASRLGRVLGPFDDDPGGPGGWWVLTEPELHFGEQILVPDLAGWRRERMPGIPDEAFFTLAPDWVCEVLSPSTERIDRSRKLRIYAAAGVKHAWLVKPTDRTLEVLRLREGTWTIAAVWEDAAVVRVEPFEAIELQLRRLWADAPTDSSST